MKRILFLFLSGVVLLSCENNDNKTDRLKLIGIIPGGCAIEEYSSLKNSKIENDTVTYTINEENLEILVGFNASCCGEYSSEAKIKNDTIFIDITNSVSGNCNCICYYKYNFIFKGNPNNHSIKVNLDSILLYEKKIQI